MNRDYNHLEIEQSIQRQWRDQKCYDVKEDNSKEKFYCLAMFPYPSGKLHMGHVRNYTVTDVISRFQRMLGKNVLHPMGWDAFGMPAENAAIQNNKSPAEWTYKNITYMRECLQSFGLSINWDREIYTCKPEYYRHEQWVFTKLYEKGIAYKKLSPVNWCDNDQTVLANEQVVDGKCWRCNQSVQIRNMSQWFLRITDYAEQLLQDLEGLNWPKEVVQMQRKWIGKSRGMLIKFPLKQKIADRAEIEVFTTRSDTLYGATYLAIAPEHPIVLQLAQSNEKIKNFVELEKQTDRKEVSIAKREKRGVDLGIHAIHPLTKELLPIWSANFVLMKYGEGAVMSVPAHDQRDYEFAKKYQLPIVPVIQGGNVDIEAFTEKGRTINSREYSDLSSNEASKAIDRVLEKTQLGKSIVQYRLRDWNVSRQRYWGAPIPMLQLESGDYVAEQAQNLPVILPEDVVVTGYQSPLSGNADWVNTTYKGVAAKRECDTFDTFMESSWYFARFTAPHSKQVLDPQAAKYWLPVDQYVGGIEHAVLHLLYARFYNKLLYDMGLVATREPFKRLLCQGMVLASSYFTKKNTEILWHHPSSVQLSGSGSQQTATLKASGETVNIGGMTKMSKSKNNGIDPMPLVAKYGADAIRLFTMFAAPPEQSMEWSDQALHGAHRFLNKLWTMYQLYLSLPKKFNEKQQNLQQLNSKLQQTIQKVCDDYKRRHTFNTAIAAIMELCNAMRKQLQGCEMRSQVMHNCMTSVLLLLQPIAPHICASLWRQMQCTGDIQFHPFPIADSEAAQAKSITYVLQVNGKSRNKVEATAGLTEQELIDLAYKDNKVQNFIQNKTVVKQIFIPNKLLNIVVR